MVMRALSILFAILLVACQPEQWDDCVTSAGPTRQDTRVMDRFSRIELEDRVDLVLEHTGSGALVVEGGANVLGQLRTEVVDGTLRIRDDNRCNWVRDIRKRITVRVPMQGVERIELRGTGRVSATDTVRGTVFRIEQHNAQGSVDLPLAVDTCFVGLHTGAGDVRLRGRCQVAYLYSGLMGPIDAGDLTARVVNVNNSGVADITCRAVQALNVRCSDVGDVLYHGDPEVSATVTGRGRVIRLGP